MVKSKLLPEHVSTIDDHTELPNEIIVMKKLRDSPHPNIMSMADAFEDEQYYYVVTPILGTGNDLFDYIESHDYLGQETIGQIFGQIASAVHHLHVNLGVSHGDIKDENIVMCGDDVAVKLIDLGSCAFIKERIPSKTFHGTSDYAVRLNGVFMQQSPEVVNGAMFYPPEQDMWSLGALLYTLAYKEVPFPTVHDILQHRLRFPFVLSQGRSACGLPMCRAYRCGTAVAEPGPERAPDRPAAYGAPVGPALPVNKDKRPRAGACDV